MRSALRKCKCGRYSLKDTCPLCGDATRVPIPPRYSPEDRYGAYRRRLKALQ